MADIYSILHHLVDKSGARDELHLRDLHDTITAQQLGFGSLEELRAEQRKALLVTDPAAAAQAQAQAFQLLAQVQRDYALVASLLQQAQEAQQAQAAAAAAAAAQAPAVPIAPAAAPAAPAVPAVPTVPLPPTSQP